MARRPASDPTTKHPSQLLALAIGAVYTLVGILGFLVTGFDNFASETNKTLLDFEINPLHNIVHLAIGLAGLALWRRLDTAKTYGWLLAAGYGLGSQRRCQSGTATRRGGLSMRELRLWAAATAGSVVAAGFYALAALRRIVGPPPSTSWAEAARWSALSIMTPVRPGIASPWRSGRICRS